MHYAPTGGLVYRTAVGHAKVYTTQICLPNSVVMVKPLLGPPDHGFNFSDLSALLNTSTFLPRTSDSWNYLPPGQDPWEVIAKTNFCVDYKNPLAHYTSPYIHSVALAGLRGRTTYTFKPENSLRKFSFTTPPEPGTGLASSPFRLGIWADIGITNISFAVMEEMLRLQPELLLTIGDLSYADGWSGRWDVFGTMMEPLLSTRYQLAVPGNHEITQNNGVDFIHRFPMPFLQSGSESPYMFSYEAGPVFIVGLPGSYAATDQASPQWRFVAEKLASVKRTRTPWLVVMFHTPWYNSNLAHYEEGLKHQWDMEGLLYKYGVDLVFNGHIHSYERSFPVFNYSRNECGMIHIVIGDGGNYEGPANYEGTPPGWKRPQPSWSAFREAAFGPGLLSVVNASHAEWAWHRVACVNRNHNRNASDAQYSYGGSRASLGRTRPITDFVWDGYSGPEGGPGCATEGDNSAQRFAASDRVVLVRNEDKCPNKVGSRSGLRISPQALPPSSAEVKWGGLTTRGWRATATLAVLLTVGSVVVLALRLQRARRAALQQCQEAFLSGG